MRAGGLEGVRNGYLPFIFIFAFFAEVRIKLVGEVSNCKIHVFGDWRRSELTQCWKVELDSEFFDVESCFSRMGTRAGAGA